MYPELEIDLREVDLEPHQKFDADETPLVRMGFEDAETLVWGIAAPIIRRTRRFRYGRSDILHPENEVFLEGSGERARFEEEADIFAQDRLISPLEFKEFITARRFGVADVTAFANSQGISAGIVAGRLCHDIEELRNDGYKRYACLRESVSWEDLASEKEIDEDPTQLKSVRRK